MNMPKSRDIQAKIPLPQAIWNFGYVTENGVNSNDYCEFFINKLVFKCAKCYNILENSVTIQQSL